MINNQHTDILLQFILAFASQADEYHDRRLRPIHLLKYAYLGDLTYAKRHGGQTFTGIPWIFYHFGPWSYEAFQRINPALKSIGASSEIFESKFDDKDREVWFWDGEDHELESLQRALPLPITLSLQQAIKRFGGTSTYDLLHYVYATEPMVTAAPNDKLIFPEYLATSSTINPEPHVLTARQRKLRREKFTELKTAFQAKVDKAIEKAVRPAPATPPVYDEIFFNSLTFFEAMTTDDLQVGDYILEVDPSVWKSGSRNNPDVS